jgi:prevent-host-death family protein
MKTMTLFEARNHFSKTVREAKKDVVIVTRRGKPVAAIQAVTENDIEDFLLERSEKFWKMIKHARRGKSLSLESARRKLKI